jgi:Protein kinase domain
MSKAPIRDLLFGRLASSGKFATEEQIAECVNLQEKYREKGGTVPRLGELLAMKGYMSPEQVRAVLDGQHTRLEGLFGEIAVRWRFVDRKVLDNALEFQREMDAAGKHRARIGEVLVGRGELQPHQVRAVLEAQGKKIMHCSGCSARFNVAHFRPGAQVSCPKCGAVTVVGEGERHVSDKSPLDVVNTIWLSKDQEKEQDLSRLSETSARRAMEIGGYEMISRLGSDATGASCKARHLSTGNVVALKIMRPGPQLGRDFLERFVEETRQAVLLDHPNLKRIYEVGSDRGRYFLAEEFIEGKSLKRQLEVVGKLTPSEAAEMIAQLCEPLSYGHRKAIYHGDLRPSNVLIDESGTVRLAGLGVAKNAALNLRYFGREASNVPYYLAPEQAVDIANTDARSDIYSLGAIFYHMLTARPPYVGQGSLEVLMRLTQEPLIPPQQIVPEVSPQLAKLVTDMLSPEPDERPQTIVEVQTRLRNAVGTLRVKGSAAKPATGGVARPVTASTVKVPTPSAPVRPAIRDRKAAEAFGERRYARERVPQRRRSSSAAPVMIGLVLGALGLVALVWYIVDSQTPETTYAKPNPRRELPENRNPRPEPVPVAKDPDFAAYSAARNFADNNRGDHEEIAKRWKAVFEKFPDSSYAKIARENHKKSYRKSVEGALNKVEKKWIDQNQGKSAFRATLSDIESWRRLYPDLAKLGLDEVKDRADKLERSVVTARTDHISKRTMDINKSIDARKFAEARTELKELSGIVSEKGAQLIADLTKKIDDAYKAHQEAERLAQEEAERKKREEAARLKKVAARFALAEKFEKARLGIAKPLFKRSFRLALVRATVLRKDFKDTEHSAMAKQIEEALQIYAAFHKVMDAGLKAGKGEPRLPFGGKARRAVGTKGSLVILKIPDGGNIELRWDSFASADVAALGLTYVNEKDAASLMGYAIFCSLVGADEVATRYLQKAEKLGARVAGLKAVLEGNLLCTDPLRIELPKSGKQEPEPPVEKPGESEKPVEKAAEAEKPRPDAGPGVLILKTTRDARIICHREERDFNYGGGQRLRTRALQSNSAEIVIMDFDRARLKDFLEKRPDRRLTARLMLWVYEVQGGTGKVEVAALDSASDWKEGDKTQKRAAKGESCSLAAQMDVELWKTPGGKEVTGFRALLYDAKKKKLKVPVNSKSAEVSRNQEAVIIDLDERLVKHLATAPNCRGLAIFTRHATGKFDFYSRERADKIPKLVISAEELRSGKKGEPVLPLKPAPAGKDSPKVGGPAPRPAKQPVTAKSGAPAELRCEALSESETNIQWKDMSTNETGFEVERSEGITDDFQAMLKAYSGKAKRRPVVVIGGFKEGALVSADGPDRWKYIPPLLRGKTVLLTSVGDAGQAPTDRKYTVAISVPCTIYLPMKSLDGGKKPPTLGSSWTKSGYSCKSVKSKDWTLWKKVVKSAGDVTLPACRDKQDGYGLCYAVVGPVRIKWRNRADVVKDSTSFKDENLKPDTVYYYRVRAIAAGGGRSRFTKTVRVATLTKLPPVKK